MSHTDHGLTQHQMQYVLSYCGGKVYEEAKANNNCVTIRLPAELGTVPCALYGPAMGDPPIGEDSVIYAKRGSREWRSRLIAESPRPTDQVTAVILPEFVVNKTTPPDDSDLVVDYVLVTAYGGPAAPREPGDPALQDNSAAQAESIEFWRHHALAADN